MSGVSNKKLNSEVGKAINNYRGTRSAHVKVKNASALMVLSVLPFVTNDTKADQLLKLIARITKEK